jgi:succinate dehydrogenase/fumarate reductase-like Fe-S protein
MGRKCTVQIYRYDPDADAPPRIQSYNLEYA